MATLVLRSAGTAIGTALGGPLGGIAGALIGAVSGGLVDGLIANALTSRRQKAQQLAEVGITHASEGTPIRKLWGRMRLGGNVIWCTQFQAVTSSQKATGASGKGIGGGSTKITIFELSFAVAFCEGVAGAAVLPPARDAPDRRRPRQAGDDPPGGRRPLRPGALAPRSVGRAPLGGGREPPPPSGTMTVPTSAHITAAPVA